MRPTMLLSVSLTAALALALAAGAPRAEAAEAGKPVKLLIVTGDQVSAHDWKATSAALKDILSAGDMAEAEITASPSTALTDENLAKYDAIVLNYANTGGGSAESKWGEANKAAFLKAVHDGGKGLVVYHYASAAFAKPNWPEFQSAVAGGWRTVGFHGPAHEFRVKKTDAKHPVAKDAPAEFAHPTDELYQNSMLTPGSVVLATAYSDPAKPKGTGKDEAVIWVNNYGKGRVFECVLGHDAAALGDKNLRDWLRRGTEWAATGKVEAKPAGK